MIRVKRIYDRPEETDGKRFLVDRLWPRGISKEKAELDGWVKEVAPSDDLRRWFGHDPVKWEEFAVRYVGELEKNSEHWKYIFEEARAGDVTLLYAAHDHEHNNAVVLKNFLDGVVSKHEVAR
jgi:uncharacterized protein YeaO (DUF488 family)